MADFEEDLKFENEFDAKNGTSNGGKIRGKKGKK